MKKKYSEIIKAIIVLIDQGLYSFTNLIIGMVLARNVSKDSYGIYVLIVSMATTIMGIQRAMISVPYTVSRKEFEDKYNSYLSSSNIFELILLVISNIFIFILKDNIGVSNNIANLLIVCIFLNSILLKDYLRSYLLTNLKISSSVILGITINILQIGILFIMYIYKESNIYTYISILAISSMLPISLFSIKYLKCRLKIKNFKIHLLNNISFGKWILASSIVASLNSQSYPMMLAFFIDNESVAVLGICIALGGILSPVIQGVYSYMLPKITNCKDDKVIFKHNIILVTIIMGIIGVIWVVTCAFIGDKLMILLYSDKYSGFKLELILASISSVISGSTVCVNAALDSLKKTNIAFNGLIMAFIVTIFGGVGLTYILGVKGSLIAMTLSNIVNFIYRYKGLMRVLNENEKYV